MASVIDIKKRIEIMQAWVDGKSLQFLNTAVPCCWETLASPNEFGYSGAPAFDFYKYQYRIKPEVVERFICQRENKTFSWSYASLLEARDSLTACESIFKISFDQENIEGTIKAEKVW